MFKLQAVNAGDILREHLRSRGINCPTRLSIGRTFLNHHPETHIYYLLRHAASRTGARIFDGIRFAVTCNQFRQADPKTTVWYVEAEARLRDARTGTSAIADSREADYPDYEDQQMIIRSMANTLIINAGRLEELKDKVRRAYCQAVR